jgi:hypothetical protein
VDPGFTAPAYPTDNVSFVSGPPSIGFIPFNTTGTCSTCPGRTSPLIFPEPVPAGFPTVQLQCQHPITSCFGRARNVLQSTFVIALQSHSPAGPQAVVCG